ncbi:unnamed protein product, partial [Hymenolepis diminuta]
LFSISSFGFYHPLSSSPKTTDHKLSSDQVVSIHFLHPSFSCFHERGFGVMGMFISFLYSHTTPHHTPLHPTPPHLTSLHLTPLHSVSSHT